jgi:hypothetical protein
MGEALYERDFVQWTEEQARALRDAARAGANLPVDWENVAEEIESLGRSERSELASRIGTIIEHLLKLQCSPAVRPRRGWRATVIRERSRVAQRLEQSPSLKRELDRIVSDEMATARKVVEAELAAFGERAPAAVPAYAVDQVLGDWLPPKP